jgi:hypothetical protein
MTLALEPTAPQVSALILRNVPRAEGSLFPTPAPAHPTASNAAASPYVALLVAAAGHRNVPAVAQLSQDSAQAHPASNAAIRPTPGETFRGSTPYSRGIHA